jgi:predicted deacylase
MLADAPAGYPAVHGLLRLADVLDAHRLAGSLLLALTASERPAGIDGLLDAAGALIVAARLPPDWQCLSQAAYVTTGSDEVDELAMRLATVSGASFCYAMPAREGRRDPLSTMSGRGRVVVRWQTPDLVDERESEVEAVFQGAINMLRVLGMLEGQILALESREVEPPGRALAPLAGLWSPAVRLGQRVRVNDRLGSFRDLRGDELGDLLSNVAGIVLGYSAAVWVDEGDSLVELARPLA